MHFQNGVNDLQGKLTIFKLNCFVKNKQNDYFINKKCTLEEGNLLLQIDFVENYSTINQDEILSAHYSHGNMIR